MHEGNILLVACVTRVFIAFDYRAAFGKELYLIIRIANPGRNVNDEHIVTHTNDTLGSLRRQILRKIKANESNVKLDLFLNGESLELADDRKILSEIPLRYKMVCMNNVSPISERNVDTQYVTNRNALRLGVVCETESSKQQHAKLPGQQFR